jgi:hypothetical protein
LWPLREKSEKRKKKNQAKGAALEKVRTEREHNARFPLQDFSSKTPS